jgi:hypothetical protein
LTSANWFAFADHFLQLRIFLTNPPILALHPINLIDKRVNFLLQIVVNFVLLPNKHFLSILLIFVDGLPAEQQLLVFLLKLVSEDKVRLLYFLGFDCKFGSLLLIGYNDMLDLLVFIIEMAVLLG